MLTTRMAARRAQKKQQQTEGLQSRLVALHLEQIAVTEQLIALCGHEQTAQVLIAAYDTARLTTATNTSHDHR